MKFNAHTYSELVVELEDYLNGCLSADKNPVVVGLPTYSPGKVVNIIKEYSQFSNEAIHMLLDARIRTYKWRSLAKEIDRNIEEEKGLETNGVPHLIIMQRGYSEGLGFDSNYYSPSEATCTFLKNMRRIFQSNQSVYLAGAILALEATANPEFYVLDKLVTSYLGRMGGIKNKNLVDYIEGHKVFEVEHKDGLIHAIQPHVHRKDFEEFASGYMTVCNVMSDWWKQLHESK